MKLEDLKGLLFQKTFKAEQNRSSYQVGSENEEFWDIYHQALIDLISEAGLNGEYYEWRRNANRSKLWIIVAFLVAIFLIWLVLKYV